ncbi:MAG: nucleotidyl transferase AbiEii/AbiGii toxin family protein [Gammaproteobacteria bacterium]|nr:nucleotidyl transferase AbiEii/AbiGii toxin family protein [Gammaproteobacteria bacterium]
MKTVALPPPLGDSLASLLKAVDGAIKEHELRLGGGTALAALWKHRFSTDIDLACDPQVFERAFSPEGRAALRERLRQSRENTPDSVLAIRLSFGIVGWKTPVGPVSIVPSRLPAHPSPWSNLKVEGTDVRLATVEAILKGKIHGRLLAKGIATQRDGYDLAVALRRSPKAAHSVLAEAHPEQLQEALAAAENQPKGGRTLINPAYPEIAADPWGEARKGLAKVLTSSDGGEIGRR